MTRAETASGETSEQIARPILFSGPMVRALLDGTKTQTRRVVKPQPPVGYNRVEPEPPGYGFRWENDAPPFRLDELGKWTKRCPYGVVGDRLWVREVFTLAINPDDSPGEGEDAEPHAIYRADWDNTRGWPVCTDGDEFRWSPSIFMPRWASRITLELTDLKVERVQDISGADAVAEGCSALPDNGIAQANFAELWNSLNAKRGFGWDVNPWAWCLTFKRVEVAT
jgi:hypothetical protein